MDIQVAYMDWSRMGMSIRNKIRDYKLRHLRLGRVKNLDKDRFDVFRIEKISWDVHWQTGLYLAVIIRDYLRFFIKNTPAIGNCVIEDHEAVKFGLDDEQSEYYGKKWRALVDSVADEFDELIKMINTDSFEIEDVKEFNKKEKELEKKAFSDLAYIFDDLFW